MPKKLWSKLDNKTTQGLFMGYKGKSYKAKVLTERKLCINKDVVVENPLTLILLVEDIVWNLKNKVVEVQQSNEDLSGCRNPTLAKCEDETHTPKVGDLESSGTPENSQLDCRGQNNSHWGVLDIIRKVSKCRCPKWPRMSHLDICSPSYGQKKGRESNWQFDSRPLKVKNRPDPNMRWESATWRWKALEKSYKIGLELVPIGGWGEKLWWPKVPGVQTGTVSGLHFGSPGTKNHLGVGAVAQRKEYYMGEGGGFPRVRAMVNQLSPRSPVACPNTKKV
jgi:hypothetical protein